MKKLIVFTIILLSLASCVHRNNQTCISPKLQCQEEARELLEKHIEALSLEMQRQRAAITQISTAIEYFGCQEMRQGSSSNDYIIPVIWIMNVVYLASLDGEDKLATMYASVRFYGSVYYNVVTKSFKFVTLDLELVEFRKLASSD